eukprot:9497736-Pyramimonas_sp.AAC.1
MRALGCLQLRRQLKELADLRGPAPAARLARIHRRAAQSLEPPPLAPELDDELAPDSPAGASGRAGSSAAQ